MIRVIPARERHFNDFGWLQTYWLFSFDTYRDPDNVNFGALRVFNDDVVAPGGGFPPHPHGEMEIVTIVLSGAVTHSDSMGNKTVIRAGDVQRMTAGTGVRHSEFNFEGEPLHLYQIWILPDKRGLTPSYEQRTTRVADYKNRLLAVASSDPSHRDVVRLNTDAVIYLSDMDAGHEHVFRNEAGRRIFLYVTAGALEVNGALLETNDQARIEGEKELTIRAQSAARFIVVEVP
ncbi:MAG TPA: pirin family protein [bacterium]|nr:pirin family protein [bacterium]